VSDVLRQRARTAVNIAFLATLAVFLGVIAGHQYLGESRDYRYYLWFFRLARASEGIAQIDSRFEVGFRFLIYCLSLLGLGNVLIYTVICSFCVLLKGVAFRAAEVTWCAASVFLYFYLTRYFILFEMTVLRASIAFSIAFFVYFRKRDTKFHWHEFLLLVAAIGFHYSAIVFLIVYFTGRLNALGVVAFGVIVFLLGFFGKIVLFTWFKSMLPVLQSYPAWKIPSTIVPIPFMFDIAMVIVALFLWRRSDVAMKYSIVGIVLSVAIHFSMVGYPTIAGRFRELLSMFILVYIVRATLSEDRTLKLLAVSFALFSGALLFYGMLFYEPLLTP